MPRFHTICYSKQSQDCQHRIKRHFFLNFFKSACSVPLLVLVIVPLVWSSIHGVILCSLRRSLSNKQLLLHQVSKSLLTICQLGLSPGAHLPANSWASPTLSIWSSWQESAQECRSLVCLQPGPLLSLHWISWTSGRRRERLGLGGEPASNSHPTSLLPYS